MFSPKILIAKKNRHHVLYWCVNGLPAAFLKPTEIPDVSKYLWPPWTTLPFVRIPKCFVFGIIWIADPRSMHWYAIFSAELHKISLPLWTPFSYLVTRSISPLCSYDPQPFSQFVVRHSQPCLKDFTPVEGSQFSPLLENLTLPGSVGTPLTSATSTSAKRHGATVLEPLVLSMFQPTELLSRAQPRSRGNLGLSQVLGV